MGDNSIIPLVTIVPNDYVNQLFFFFGWVKYSVGCKNLQKLKVWYITFKIVRNVP